jgi:peptide/nickel transport system permease protein
VARYLTLRIVNVVPVMLITSFIVFLVTFLLPGDPAQAILGQSATPASLAAIRHELGLDQPFLVRYAIWLSHIARGDLGQSFVNREPVTTLISQALPVSMELLALSLLVAVAIAVPAATASALRKDSWVDLVVSAASFSGLAIPSFWLALMLIYLFAVNLGVLPTEGFVPLTDDVGSNLEHMAMPAFTLGIFLAAPLTRYLRAGILGVMVEDHVQLALMKGLTRREVVVRHVLRNALIPFTTVLGIQFAYLLGGAIVVEQIFALPGMGRLGLQAVFDRDYEVLQGVALVVTIGFVVTNLVVDIIYGFLDPRIRVAGPS